MVYIKTNLNNFSRYTLTSFFYGIKPRKIWFSGNVILIDAKNRPSLSFVKESYKIIKRPDLKKYQRVHHEVINQNYYVKAWNK